MENLCICGEEKSAATEGSTLIPQRAWGWALQSRAAPRQLPGEKCLGSRGAGTLQPSRGRSVLRREAASAQRLPGRGVPLLRAVLTLALFSFIPVPWSTPHSVSLAHFLLFQDTDARGEITSPVLKH